MNLETDSTTNNPRKLQTRDKPQRRKGENERANIKDKKNHAQNTKTDRRASRQGECGDGEGEKDGEGDQTLPLFLRRLWVVVANCDLSNPAPLAGPGDTRTECKSSRRLVSAVDFLLVIYLSPERTNCLVARKGCAKW